MGWVSRKVTTELGKKGGLSTLVCTIQIVFQNHFLVNLTSQVYEAFIDKAGEKDTA